MKAIMRTLSVVLVSVILISCFCFSGSAKTDTITVTFHNNNLEQVQDIFDKQIISKGDTLNFNYEIPFVGDEYIFKGWYYGTGNNARAVDFESDTFNSDTDIYAQWITVGLTDKDNDDVSDSGGDRIRNFELIGVQVREEMWDNNYQEVRPAGLRYIVALNNNLLRTIDNLSDRTVTSEDGYTNRVEYGFVVTKKTNVDNWLEYAGNHIEEDTYKLQYKGTNVNGINTTKRGVNYQGFVTNIDCTASDYSTRQIRDHKKFDDYRLYSLVVAYDDNSQNQMSEKIAARGYLRYYDANGNLRTHYNDYGGTNTYGGCGTSYINAEQHVHETEPFVYYSSLPLCAVDVQNLNNNSADVTESDIENAVVAMRVDGTTCYMKLMKDTSINTIVRFREKCDFDLQGHTLTNLAGASTTWFKDAKLYNGDWELSEAQQACAFAGTKYSVSNIDFSGSVRNGCVAPATAAVTETKVKNCTFDLEAKNINNKCSAAIMVSETCTNHSLTVDNCNIYIDNPNNVLGIYGIYIMGHGNGTSNTIKNSSIFSENNSVDCPAYAIQSNSDASVQNCSLRVDLNEEITSNVNYYASAGILNIDCPLRVSNCDIVVNLNDNSYITPNGIESGNTTDNLYRTEVSNTSVTMNLNINTYCNGIGCFSDNKRTEFTIHNNTKIKVNDNCNTSLTESSSGIYLSGDATANIDYCSVDVPLGYDSGTWKGLAMYYGGNSVVNIRENEGPVYMHGGNAGLASGETNSIINIYGGKFCSATHGGAYFGSETNIYGGEFYNSYDAGEEPANLSTKFPAVLNERYAGAYITYNAVVNAQNASFLGGIHGVRLRANGGNACNPIVNLTDCYVEGDNDAISISVGRVTVNSGTVCVPEITANGTTLIDNR